MLRCALPATALPATALAAPAIGARPRVPGTAAFAQVVLGLRAAPGLEGGSE